MKIFMIGMDGVSFETFQRGWTPFIFSLISKGSSLELHEDLLSRGWSEIVTGKHAIDTGALYERPLMERAYGWTESYKLNDVPGLGEKIKPIWQVFNEKGWRVGIMNVPTTYPAPAVDGFFVSGGGGGGPVDQNITLEQCYPPRIKEQLAEQGYIVDERFGSLLGDKKLYEPCDFFERLKEMNSRRTIAFKKLAAQEEIDFGFLVYKSSTVGTESLIAPELDKKRCGLKYNEDMLLEAKAFYEDLDKHIQSLVESFSEAQIFLVSDHSTITQKAAVNLNYFLIEQGLQFPSVARRGIYDLVRSFKHFIPHSVRQRLKKNKKIRQSYESITTFDHERSKAFCMAFSNGAHGIYVNDDVRFTGPVESSNVDDVADEIIRKFNEHPLSLLHGFKARCKSNRNRVKSALQFPDIVITLPDGYQTSNRYQEFIHPCELPDSPLSLREAERDLRYTGKGHRPLAINVTGEWSTSELLQEQDLTVVYNQLVSLIPDESLIAHRG